ncbi:divalent-cation tolerance protein CutA [Streptomyces griseoviridis]|uniref:divalent-cation tolerance protein CutA n=1 Tax=Streptomyces griseoviridis TaxID=45398 RepID=UPI003410641E
MADYLTVFTATETHDQAVNLARSAVQARLAAGAQITGPVTSAFWHAGDFGTGQEYQLRLTTSGARYADLEAHLTENHPWTTPEITATAIVRGSSSYLEWVDRTTA